MDDRQPEWLLAGPDLKAEIRRYVVAALAVAAVGGGVFFWVGRTATGDAASQIDDAIIVDLPPAITSSLPRSEATDTSPQDASVAAPVALPIETAKSVPPPEALPPAPPDPQATSPPRLAPPKPDQVASPQAAAAAAQVETAPAGVADPAAPAEPIESPAMRRRAAAALSKWQLALVGRLERAKRDVHSAGFNGRVDIAFSVDRRGRLVSHRIVHSSGSEKLDRLAMELIERAAPFPEPPAVSGDALIFSVPIIFSRRGS